MPSVTDATQQTNETFPQQNLTPKPASRLKTILMVIVGLVFVSSVAFAGFWYGKNSQAPVSPEKEATSSTETVKEELPVEVDETAGWETYNNETYGYSLRYPDGWEDSLTESAGMIYLSIFGLVFTDKSQGKVTLPGEIEDYAKYLISVTVSDNSTGATTVKDIKEEYLSKFSAESRSAAADQLQEVVVGGISGVRYYVGSAPSSGVTLVVRLAKGAYIYEISYGAIAHLDTHNNYLPGFETLLSTFKFTD